MPALTIPDEIFERLLKRAAALNLTVEPVPGFMGGLPGRFQGAAQAIGLNGIPGHSRRTS